MGSGIGVAIAAAVNSPSVPSLGASTHAATVAQQGNIESNLIFDPFMQAATNQQANYQLFGSPAMSYVGPGGVTYNIPAQPGSLQMMEQAQPTELALQQKQLAGEVADVSGLAPQVYQTEANFNPAVTDIFSTLGQQAAQQLAQNGALTPAQTLQTTQTIRGAQSARGLGWGPGDAAVEGQYVANTQQARQASNQNFAGGVANAIAGYYGNPFQMVGTAAGLGSPNVNYGATGGSPGVNPNSASSLISQYYQAQTGASAAQYAAQMAALGKVASGPASTLSLLNSLGVNTSGLFGTGQAGSAGTAAATAGAGTAGSADPILGY